MISIKVTIKKFDDKGEKTGWTYFDIPVDIALQLKPNNRREFKVKGTLDAVPFKHKSLFPMGNGHFIFVLNAELRKLIGKKLGAALSVKMQEDKSAFIFNIDFIVCLADEPYAQSYFKSLTASHQRYFSKWIDEAKTDATKTKRIAMAVNALTKRMGYPEMIKSNKN